VRHPRAERYEWHIHDRIERLRATNLNDLNAAWAATVDVLAALYRSKEAERKISGEDAYREHQKASADGRTLAGLLWLRNKVEHHQAEIEVLVGGTVVTTGGEPLTIGGELVRVNSIVEFRWPPWRTLLFKEQEGSDERASFYEEHVEGPDVLGPLDRAAGYLLAR
jgi:hypothetical protein